MSFIEFRHVSHTYRLADGAEKAALNDITLSIEAGEFVAVLGANGSGKSTLAKHLNALLVPSSGSCLIDGKDTQNLATVNDIRRQVGMVFQNPDNQIIAATVEDDVAFGPENLGLPPDEIRRRVTDSLQAVGMKNKRRSAPHLLSGGQKQRLAIAGALAMATKCLVLDEPTAMLDPEGRQEVMTAVKKLHREQKLTVVYITHFMEEAARATRVIVMHDGRIVMDGKPAELLTREKELLACALTVPLAVQVATALRQKGIKLSPRIYTAENLVAELCPLK